MSRRLYGKIASWGNGDHGRLGHGSLTGRAIPSILAALLDQSFYFLDCGGAHTAAVAADGSVFTWGLNDYGQLGHYTHQDSFKQAGLLRASQCADLENPFFKCLSIIKGTFGNFQEPAEVLLPEAVTAVALGHSHTLFLTENSTLWAVGSNRYGQLGLRRRGGQEWLPRRVQDLVGQSAILSIYFSVKAHLIPIQSLLSVQSCIGNGPHHHAFMKVYTNRVQPDIYNPVWSL